MKNHRGDSTGGDTAQVRSRRRRAAWAVFGACAIILAAFAVGTLLVAHQLSSAITTIADPFAAIPSRPPTPAEPEAEGIDAKAPMNILLLGSDSRGSAGDPGLWEYGGQRTDTMMLLHIPGDRQGAFVISFPRDSWVDIPGHGYAKFNAAYSYGGVPPGVSGELCAAIPGESLAQLLGQLRHRIVQRSVHCDGSIPAERGAVLHRRALSVSRQPGKVHQQRGTAAALDDRADR